MNMKKVMSTSVLAAAITGLVGGGAGIANATQPCDDFGECKALVEINASDGDIGFHFLMDGDALIYGALFNPKHRKIFTYYPRRELRRQTSTELFQESAEPPCSDDVAEEGDDVVTLAEFTNRWRTGTYYFFGINSDWEPQFGESELTFDLPAAPADVEYEAEEDDEGDIEGEISWDEGDDLGECSGDLDKLVRYGVVADPEDVDVALWEVVLEPDVEDGDILGSMKYTVRIPYADEYGVPTEREVEVPDDYLETLPSDTPAKAEVGAIGFDDNATFSEVDEICLNDTDPEGTLGPNPDPDEEDGDEEVLLNGCGFVVEEEEDGDE